MFIIIFKESRITLIFPVVIYMRNLKICRHLHDITDYSLHTARISIVEVITSVISELLVSC